MIPWCVHPAREQIKSMIEYLSQPVTESGCWIWMGRMKTKNYGAFCYEGRHYRVHRVVYEVFHERPLRRDTVDHLCGVSTCVNPSHLEAIPWKVHAKRNRERLRDSRC